MFTETDEYKKLMKKIQVKKQEDKTWRAVVTLVKDTELLYFLETKYPDVLEEFYKERQDKNEHDTEI